jgi:signal transduction histidine kinase
LRTPLTIIRTELDVALADPHLPRAELEAAAAAMRDALARSEEVIDGLLVLARSDALTQTEAVDLAGLVRASLEQHAAVADASGLGAELGLEPAIVEGDRRLLGRMVDNLVENALRHNEQGGWLRVSSGQDEERATLVVANGGPVLSEEDGRRLFERFFRAESSRSRRTGGAGLGLSIVRAVVDAHGGHVEAVPLPGGGLRVSASVSRSGQRGAV